MRTITGVLMSVLVLVGAARDGTAQNLTIQAAERPLLRAFNEATRRESPTQLVRYPGPRRVHHCCHVKGALIGAGIGAAAGFAIARLYEGDRTTTYIRCMGTLGGIGAGLGAFVDRRHGAPGFKTP